MAKQNNTKVVTGIVRLSYANIWDPKAPVSGGDPCYSCSLIIPKSDTETVDAINRAIRLARSRRASASSVEDPEQGRTEAAPAGRRPGARG